MLIPRSFWISLLFTGLVAIPSLQAQPASAPEASDVDSTQIRSPRKALFLAILPGLGQVYNRDYLKAILATGAFTAFTLRYLDARQAYQDAPGDAALHRKRNDQAWLMGLTWTLGVLDAFIDAQLSDAGMYGIDDSVIPAEKQPTETEGEQDDTK